MDFAVNVASTKAYLPASIGSIGGRTRVTLARSSLSSSKSCSFRLPMPFDKNVGNWFVTSVNKAKGILLV